MQLVLRSNRGATRLGLLLHPALVGAVRVEGALVPETGRPMFGVWKIMSMTAAPTGLHLLLRIRGSEPLDVIVIDESTGLPEQGRALKEMLPTWAATAQDGDSTVVVRRERL